MPFRTMLFTPGDHERKVAKVFNAGADAVILDLEDAVAAAAKPAARAPVVEALQRPRSCLGYVRVNALDTEFCWDDLAAVVGPGLDGIVLPKAESADHLKTADWAIANLERQRGLAPGAIDLIPIVETAKGQRALPELTQACARVKRLAFGAGDFTLDLNMRWSLAETELSAVRSDVVMHSRAAGIEPPIDTVFIHLNEAAAFDASTELARNLGFQGKLCIHPGQIAAANRIFTPTAEELAYARKVADAFDAAEAAGSASIQVEGYFVDYPIVEKARRAIALAEAIGKA